MRPRIVEFLLHSPFPWLAALVPTPGAVYSITFVILIVIFVYRCRRSGLSPSTGLEVACAAGFGALAGARVFYLVTRGDLFHLAPRLWFDPTRGTASWGAYLGAALGIATYALITRVRAVPYLDTAASVAGLGEACGRWSCFLAGDDFGRVSEALWAVQYPKGSDPFSAHLERGLVEPTAELSLAVHPVQFYLMAGAVLVFLLTSRVWHSHRHVPGYTIGAFFVLLGVIRFPLEFFRDPAAGGAVGLLSQSQWMCLVLLALGGSLLAVARRTAPVRPA